MRSKNLCGGSKLGLRRERGTEGLNIKGRRFAIVIGKPAAHVSVADAPAVIFGYTQFMDISARGLPGGFFLGKSWHGQAWAFKRISCRPIQLVRRTTNESYLSVRRA